MKTTILKYGAGLLLVALGAASCTKDNGPDGPENDYGPVEFTAVMTDFASGPGNRDWSGDELIGLKSGSELKTYTVSSDGKLSIEADPWIWEGTAYDVLAWTPLTEGQISLADQTTDDKVKACDLLAGTASVNARQTEIRFSHKMTKVCWELNAFEGYTAEEVAAAEISFKGYGAVTFAEGEVTPAGNPDVSILCNETSGTVRKGEAMMAPCEMWDKVLIEVKIGEDEYKFTPTRTGDDGLGNIGELVSGKCQVYTLNVDRDKLSVSMESGEIGWENGSVGGVTDADFMVSVSGEVSGKPGYSIVGVDALGFITGGSVVVTYTEEGTGGLDVKGICNVERKVDGTTHTYTITGIDSDIEVSYMESYITVGDYFYSDGTTGSAESENTIGRVYRLGAHDTDDPSVYGMDKINGYVVCTVPVDGTYSWLKKEDDPAYKGILANLEGLAKGDCNNVEKYLGYPLTNAIRAALDNYATIETDFPFWHKFATLAAAPKNTSGWYIPSVAQLADIDNSNVVPDFEGQYYSSNVYAELSGTEVLRMWAIEYNTAEKQPKNDWASDAKKMIVMLTF